MAGHGLVLIILKGIYIIILIIDNSLSNFILICKSKLFHDLGSSTCPVILAHPLFLSL